MAEPFEATVGFCREQLKRVDGLWERMLRHPFLLETRDGSIARETFANWMRQDYLFVEAAAPFLLSLRERAPARHREPLSRALEALERELDLFRERAELAGVELEGAEPAFICHAYIQFLHASACMRSYPEAFTVLCVAEKAYHASWSVVRAGLDPSSPWWPFVENWTSEAFATYVAWLEEELDGLAAAAGSAARRQMAECFELTVKYEIAFWELAIEGSRWPGLEEVVVDPISREG